MTEPDYLLGIHNFCNRSPDEISISRGDYIEVIEDDSTFNDSWYVGRNLRTNMTGLFPKIFTTAVARLPDEIKLRADQLQAEQIPTPVEYQQQPSAPPLDSDYVATTNTNDLEVPPTNSALSTPSVPQEDSWGSYAHIYANSNLPTPNETNFDLDYSNSSNNSINNELDAAISEMTRPIDENANLNAIENEAAFQGNVLPAGQQSVEPELSLAAKLKQAAQVQQERQQQQQQIAQQAAQQQQQQQQQVPQQVSRHVSQSSHVTNQQNSDPGILNWSAQDVERFFYANGFVEEAPLFARHRVSGPILLEMDRDTLKEIEIDSFGPRYEIYKIIQQLREECGMSLHSFSSPSSPSSVQGNNSINEVLSGTNSVQSSFKSQHKPEWLANMSRQGSKRDISPNVNINGLKISGPNSPSYQNYQGYQGYSNGIPNGVPNGYQNGYQNGYPNSPLSSVPSAPNIPHTGLPNTPGVPNGVPNGVPVPNSPNGVPNGVPNSVPGAPGAPAVGTPMNTIQRVASQQRADSNSRSSSRVMSKASQSDLRENFGTPLQQLNSPSSVQSPTFHSPILQSPSGFNDANANTNAKKKTHERSASGTTSNYSMPTRNKYGNPQSNAHKRYSSVDSRTSKHRLSWASLTHSRTHSNHSVGNLNLSQSNNKKDSSKNDGIDNSKVRKARSFGVLTANSESVKESQIAEEISAKESAARIKKEKQQDGTLKSIIRPSGFKQKTSAFQEGIKQVTASEASKTADKSGWMYKRNGTGIAVWSKRFFTLHGTRLSYFSSFKEKKERGLIDITGHRVLPVKDSELLVNLTAAGLGGGRYCFKLIPPGPGYKKGVAFTAPKVHYFSVETEAEMSEWQSALMSATIERDESVPALSTCQTPTMSLPKAQELMAERLATKGNIGSLSKKS